MLAPISLNVHDILEGRKTGPTMLNLFQTKLDWWNPVLISPFIFEVTVSTLHVAIMPKSRLFVLFDVVNNKTPTHHHPFWSLHHAESQQTDEGFHCC